MKSVSLLSLATALLSSTASAISVSGEAEGFASGVTGGGSAEAVYPESTDELVSYLGDDQARVIVLSQTYIQPIPLQRHLSTKHDTNMLRATASISPVPKAPLMEPAAPPGVPTPAARSPSTRTTGAPTTSPMLPPSMSLSTFNLLLSVCLPHHS